MNKPKHIDKIAVDADIVAYRAAFSTQGEYPWACEEKVDTLMEYIVGQTVVFRDEDNFGAYLTGKGNYRYNIAKTHEYKGNRSADRPEHLPVAREHLQTYWDAVVVNGIEADDAIATEAMKHDPEAFVICSIDKDMKTIPCWLFNFVNGSWTYSNEKDALEFFYKQILTGDTADAIVGLHRVGPKTADKIVEGWYDEKDLFDKVLKAYKESPTLEGDPYERMIENARLLHLQRYKGELWQPPEGC